MHRPFARPSLLALAVFGTFSVTSASAEDVIVTPPDGGAVPAIATA